MKLLATRKYWCVSLLLSALLLALPIGAHAAKRAAKKVESDVTEGPKPWVLHPRYTFTMGKYAMDFDETTSEWRIFAVNNTPEGETLVQGAGAAILFGDGASLRATDLAKGTTSREPFSNAFGEGTHYTLTFPPKDGLVVSVRASTFKTWQFALLSMSVTNETEKAVAVRELTPLSIGSGGMIGLGPNTIHTPRPLVLRAGYPVYDAARPASMTLFFEPDRNMCLAFGTIPQGRAASSAVFQATGGIWQGQVSSCFAPAIVLAPGQTLESDSVWLSFGIENPAAVDELYAWALSKCPRPALKWETMRPVHGWVTVEEGKDLRALTRAVQLAPSMGIGYALIPCDWEGRPGSLEGAAPRYPKNMGQAAKALRDAGVVPGISVDPLSGPGGDKQWAAVTPDGRTWLNLAMPEGRAQAEKNIKTIAGWGFAFFAAAHSVIPDEVLTAFGLTRVEADRLAFETLAGAAGGLPVFPTAGAPCKPTVDACLAAAAAAARVSSNLIVAGPLRLAAEGLAELPENGAALRFWPGPIEVLGIPAAKCRESLAAALMPGSLNAVPMDVSTPAPKLWRVSVENAANGYLASTVVCFPGAPAWTGGAMKPKPDQPFLVWNGSTGAQLDETQSVTPGAGLEIYGLAPQGAAPSFLGLSTGLALTLDHVVAAHWNESEALLNVSLKGPIAKDATARVHIPEPWQFATGKAGETPVRKGVMAGRILSFDLEGGDAAQFALKFKKP